MPGTETMTNSPLPRPWRRRLKLLAAVAALVAAIAAPAATGGGETAVKAEKHMVAAANAEAARAGLEVLRRGGGAVDAAIATLMVLGLVEPQSSGLGGGGFLLHFEADGGEVVAYDGRETAPAAASGDMFLDPSGEPMKFFTAVVGGGPVGVPGLLAMLELAHQRHGKLPWADLFRPAIRLAEEGSEVSPRLAMLIARDRFLATFSETRAYFYHPDGTPLAAGERLVNKTLAQTLRLIAAKGGAGFYQGEVARDIVRAVRGTPDNPGRLSLADLSAYRAKARRPVCGPFRLWRICGMPPPSSGGIAVLQILGILAHTPIAGFASGSAEAVHLISEASRLGFADRARYLGDGDFVAVPLEGLIDSSYLGRRAGLIRMDSVLDKAGFGTPPHREGRHPVWQPAAVLPSTTHLSVVDGAGNAVALTASIENVFGSRLMARGFLLNNELTDFSFRPVREGAPHPNRVEPGKRPLSSMSPTLVFDSEGKLVLAIGSPGGSRIIAYVSQVIVAVLDWGLDVQQAIDLPHHVNRGGATELEKGSALEGLEAALRSLGHEVRVRELNSGLHGVHVLAPGLEGGADRRREGVVLGD